MAVARGQQQAEKTAKNLLADSRLTDDQQRADYSFRLLVGHSPDAQQKNSMLAFLKDYAAALPGNIKPEQRQLEAWATVCQTLMASAEFRYVY